jgi:hypothetical protein
MAEPHTLAAELHVHVVELLDEHGRPGRAQAHREAAKRDRDAARDEEPAADEEGPWEQTAEGR